MLWINWYLIMQFLLCGMIMWNKGPSTVTLTGNWYNVKFFWQCHSGTTVLPVVSVYMVIVWDVLYLCLSWISLSFKLTLKIFSLNTAIIYSLLEINPNIYSEISWYWKIFQHCENNLIVVLNFLSDLIVRILMTLILPGTYMHDMVVYRSLVLPCFKWIQVPTPGSTCEF